MPFIQDKCFHVAFRSRKLLFQTLLFNLCCWRLQKASDRCNRFAQLRSRLPTRDRTHDCYIIQQIIRLNALSERSLNDRLTGQSVRGCYNFCRGQWIGTNVQRDRRPVLFLILTSHNCSVSQACSK